MKKEGTRKVYGDPIFCGGAFFAMIFCYILVSLVGNAILSAFNAGKVVSYAVRATFSIAAMVIVQTVFAVKRKVKFYRLANFNKFNPVYTVLAVLLGAGMMAGLGFVNEGIASVMQKAGLKVTAINLPIDSPFNFILFSVLIAVLPAIFEEGFFRGLLLDGLTDGSENPFCKRNVCAEICVATCFALYHGSLTQLVYQFVYGWCLAVLTIKAGSAIPSVLAHFINNFAVIFCAYAGIEINLFNPVVIVSGIACLAAFFALIAFFGNESAKPENAEKENKETDAGFSFKRFWLPFGIAGVAVCAVLIISSAVAI